MLHNDAATAVKPSKDNRTERRAPVRIPARIQVYDPDREIAADIVDYSQHGMGLVISEKIAQDAAVIVKYNGVWIFADTMYCLPLENSYRIGLCLRHALATEAAAMTSEVASKQLATAFL
jgi:hypothetical protein